MIGSDFDRLEENIKFFIMRMQEKYQENKYTINQSSRKALAQQHLDEEETSDVSSLDDLGGEEMGLAEQLFSKPLTKPSSTQGTPNTFKVASEVQIQQVAPSDFISQLGI